MNLLKRIRNCTVSGEETNITAKERGLIRSALRKIWMWSDVRKGVKQRAKVGGQYFCEMCGCAVKYNQMDIDHIHAVGATPGSRLATEETTWDSFISRLFCPPSNLRAICKACHAGITAKQRAASSKKKLKKKKKAAEKTSKKAAKKKAAKKKTRRKKK